MVSRTYNPTSVTLKCLLYTHPPPPGNILMKTYFSIRRLVYSGFVFHVCDVCEKSVKVLPTNQFFPRTKQQHMKLEKKSLAFVVRETLKKYRGPGINHYQFPIHWMLVKLISNGQLVVEETRETNVIIFIIFSPLSKLKQLEFVLKRIARRKSCNKMLKSQQGHAISLFFVFLCCLSSILMFQNWRKIKNHLFLPLQAHLLCKVIRNNA